MLEVPALLIDISGGLSGDEAADLWQDFEEARLCGQSAHRTGTVSLHSSGILVTIRDEVLALEGSTLYTVRALALASLYLKIVFPG